MNCPKCANSELVAVISEEGFPLDYCPACFGIWFDQGETAQHFDLEQDVPDISASLKNARKTGLICPRCQKELEEILYDEKADLLLDRCESCHGLWFDCQETEKLQQWAVSGESPRTRMARAVRRLKEDGYKII